MQISKKYYYHYVYVKEVMKCVLTIYKIYSIVLNTV